MSDFFSKMGSYAKQCQKDTNIDYRVILAQWYLESTGGTSDLCKRALNFAGIKSSSKGKDFTSGRYAGYNSIKNFAKDYSRVMNLSYYDGVRSADGVVAQIKALGESPWAEDGNYGEKILDIVKKNGLETLQIADLGSGDGIGEKIINVVKSPYFIGGLALIIVLKG